MTADTAAAAPHHEYSLNTPHAAIANPTTATSAKALASVHAVPVGGGVWPAKAGVIQRKVVPKRNSPSAKMFLKVHIARPRTVAGASLFGQAESGRSASSGAMFD